MLAAIKRNPGYTFAVGLMGFAVLVIVLSLVGASLQSASADRAEREGLRQVEVSSCKELTQDVLPVSQKLTRKLKKMARAALAERPDGRTGDLLVHKFVNAEGAFILLFDDLTTIERFQEDYRVKLIATDRYSSSDFFLKLYTLKLQVSLTKAALLGGAPQALKEASAGLDASLGTLAGLCEPIVK